MFSDDDRERPSWREIDRRKDRSRHVRDERPERESKKSRAIAINYKHKLKEAFKSGKVAEAIDKLEGDTEEKRLKRENLRILREGADVERFRDALNWYLSSGIESLDVDILNRALSFDDAGIATLALNFVKSAKNFDEIISSRLIVEKLNLLLMTTRDLKLKFMIRELLNKGKD
jgi:hypothetical protein